MSPSTTGSQTPPKDPKTTGGNGHGTSTPKGPSKWVRDDYIRKVEEIRKKKKLPPAKPTV